MKILVIADIESEYLWDYFKKEKLDGIDLILSAGDLNPNYLSFLATFAKVPVLYIRGNHDDCYKDTPPEGCTCIENKVYVYKGVRILGLGGSIRYKKGDNQYTQLQMKRRASKAWFNVKKNKGIDILLTHSPAKGLNDGPDHVHEGFEVFNDLIRKYKPKFFIHGHVHKNYCTNFKHEFKLNEYTTVVNGYERYIIDYPMNEEKVIVEETVIPAEVKEFLDPEAVKVIQEKVKENEFG